MAKEEQLLLLDFGVSPFCQRVKIALAEKGVDYDSKEEDLFGGKSDLLLKSNPIYQKVPVLLYNDKPVLESTNIVYFIDENWPSPPLLPSCPYGRSRARFWVDYIDKKVLSFYSFNNRVILKEKSQINIVNEYVSLFLIYIYISLLKGV